MKRSRIEKFIIAFSALFYVGTIVIGIIRRSFRLYVPYGAVGIVSCLLGFIGSSYEQTGKQRKTYLVFTLLFLALQIFFHTNFTMVGTVWVNFKVAYGFYFVAHGIILAVMIFIPVLVTGVILFVDLFIGVYSIMEILGSVGLIIYTIVFRIKIDNILGIKNTIIMVIIISIFIIVRGVFAFWSRRFCWIVYVVMSLLLIVGLVIMVFIVSLHLKKHEPHSLFTIEMVVLVYCIVRLLITLALLIVRERLKKKRKSDVPPEERPTAAESGALGVTQLSVQYPATAGELDADPSKLLSGGQYFSSTGSASGGGGGGDGFDFLMDEPQQQQQQQQWWQQQPDPPQPNQQQIPPVSNNPFLAAQPAVSNNPFLAQATSNNPFLAQATPDNPFLAVGPLSNNRSLFQQTPAAAQINPATAATVTTSSNNPFEQAIYEQQQQQIPPQQQQLLLQQQQQQQQQLEQQQQLLLQQQQQEQLLYQQQQQQLQQQQLLLQQQQQQQQQQQMLLQQQQQQQQQLLYQQQQQPTQSNAFSMDDLFSGLK